MATVNGSPPFPILVLDNEAAISVDAVAPLAARLGVGLTGTGSVYDLLQDWQRNFAALCRAVRALDDAELGKYTRSAFAALEFFDVLAPISSPRQIFKVNNGISCRPVSALAGPRAKVPLPPDASYLTAGTDLAVVVGAPAYKASEQEVRLSVAGLMVATQYRTDNGCEIGPALLPTGPYFVPLPFCPDALVGRIAFNGESSIDFSADISQVSDAVRQVSAVCHLFPGDLIVFPVGERGSAPLSDGDIVETAIADLGQQTTNIIVESKHANPGD